MHRVIVALSAVLLSSAVPCVATAQTLTPFAELHRELDPGDRITVTDREGERVSGTIAEVTESALVLSDVRSKDGRGTTRTFTDGGVGHLERRDSLDNGALLGLLGGAMGAWAFTRSQCGPRGYDSECSAIAGAVGSVVFVPIGTVVGLLVDRGSRQRFVLAAPASGAGRSTLGVAPLVGSTRHGVALSWTF